MPKVSVIVAAYNVEEYIEETLHSLINQTLEDVEFVVVNDCSTDKTGEILDSWAKEYPKINHVLLEKNSGPLIVRKIGSEIASGEYVMFLDGDDVLDFNACEKGYKAIKKSKTDILQFKTNIIIDGDIDATRIPEIDGMHEYLRCPEMKIFSTHKSGLLGTPYNIHFNFTVWNKIYKKSLITKVNKHIPDKCLLMAEDLLFSYITHFIAKSFAFSDEILYNYRFGCGISTTQKISPQRMDSIAQSSFVYTYLRDWTEKQGIKADSIQKLNLIKLQLYRNISHAFLLQIANEDKNCFANKVLEYFSLEEFMTMLTFTTSNDHMTSYDVLAESCSLLDIFRTTKNDIKTIATFYHRVCNGGIENVISKLTDLWIKNGYNVILFTDQEPDENDYYLNPSITRIVLPTFEHGDFKSYSERIHLLYTTLQKHNVDIMVYHAWCSHSIVSDSMVVKSLGIPFVVHTHSTYCAEMLTDAWEYAYISTLMPKMYSLSDMVIALNKSDCAYWQAMGLRCLTTINPTAISLDTEVSQLNGQNIIMVCRLSREKQVLDAIKIVEKVSKKIPDVSLTIVGSGDDAGYCHLIDNYIKTNKLEDIVTMVGFKKDVTPYYSKADIMLMTSQYEGAPLTLMESKILGLPLVIYDLSNLDTVREAKGMFVVPQNNIDAAAEKIIDLLSDDNLKKRMGKEARKSAEEILSVDLAEHWKYIFDFTIDKEKPVPKMDLCDINTAMRTLVSYNSQGIKNRGGQSISSPLSESYLATIKEIRASTSYRLGWFLTTIPRKIKDFIKGQKYIE